MAVPEITGTIFADAGHIRAVLRAFDPTLPDFGVRTVRLVD